MSNPSSDTKENTDNKAAESGDGFSKKDKGEDNDQTPDGKKSDSEHKNENKQNGDNSNWKGRGEIKIYHTFFRG